MTTILDQKPRAALGESLNEGHPSPRQVWAERRRFMEAQKAQFGPDGARSLWRSRIFSIGLDVFDGGARLMRLHERGRRNALDVQLVTRSISFANLPLF